MKNIKTKFILTTLVFTLAFIVVGKIPLRDINTYFTMNDKKGDDFGAGDIKYPKSLEGKENIFDIRKFSVNKDKDNVVFEYKMENLDNEYNNKNGFSHIILDTYISTSEDGLQGTIDYGVAVNFNDEYPWQYHIRINPEEAYVERLVDRASREMERIDCELIVKENTINLIVKKENLPENLTKAKYYVFTGGFDVFAADNYRKIESKENEWNFYGGIDSIYQPKILDIVSPIQREMLIYFMPPINAVISPIFNMAHNLIITRELLMLILSIWLGIKYFFMFKKYKNMNDAIKEETTN